VDDKMEVLASVPKRGIHFHFAASGTGQRLRNKFRASTTRAHHPKRKLPQPRCGWEIFSTITQGSPVAPTLGWWT
jgi:hypothetical protein